MRHRPIVISMLLALSLGVLMLASSATPAGGGSTTRGGTLRVAESIQSIDPADAYYWLLNTATLPLVSFPDRWDDQRLLPAGAAARPGVSADRRTYTFTIRKGLRFSDGRPVTARNYEAAFRRFFAKYPRDPTFSDIVGARAANEGEAPSGVQVRGGKLVIRLVAPAGDLLVRLASGPITATPLDLPLSGVRAPLPSAGPYYVKEFAPDESALLVRNPYWRRDLLPWRPANVDSIVFGTQHPPREWVRLAEEGQIDVAYVRPNDRAAVATKYGVNTGRFRLDPSRYVWVLAFNLDRPLFRGNPSLRRAVNFALDRRDLVSHYFPLTGRRTDQLFTPALLGYRDAKIYPLKGPDLERARGLARGHLRGGSAVLWTWTQGMGGFPGAEDLAHGVKFQLAKIGLDVEIQVSDPAVSNEKAGKRDAGWDIALYKLGSSTPDPGALNVFDSRYLPYGTLEGSNYSRFRSATFDRRLRAAHRLSGKARLEAYRAIEVDLLRDEAPMAPFMFQADAVLLSSTTGCYAYNPLGTDLAAICTKLEGGVG